MTRLPRRLEFPEGYVVTVVQVEPDQLEGAYAEWDVDTRTVLIDRTRPLAEKRWLLYVHEWDHITTDWKHWLGQRVAMVQPEGMQPNPEEREEEEA